MKLFNKPPFLVTHYSDWAASQDAIATRQDIINNSNIEMTRNGVIRPRKSWTTFAGMVHQLWLINKRYQKMGIKGKFTVTLPLKSGGYKGK